MSTVWWVFGAVALALVALGAAAATRPGPRAAPIRVVGRGLLVLGGGTAAFPALLGPLPPWTWAGADAAFVAATTALMTRAAIREARPSTG